jgi:hypothetical protein
MDHAEAQRLSDFYMSALVADRVDLALDKWGLISFKQLVGK